MSDHSPCIKLNQSSWIVDGAGEPINCDERSGHPDDEEVLDDEEEYIYHPNMFDLLDGVAAMIGKYLSLLGGDAETNTLIAKTVIAGCRFYQDAREGVLLGDRDLVMATSQALTVKLYDVARALHLSREAKNEEERKAHEERLKMMQAGDDRLKQEIEESNDATITRVIEAYIAKKKALKKEKAERAPVTDLY